LALIGEQFDDDSELVNGVWVNVRPRGNKIAIWTKAARNAEAQLRIGNKIKEVLAIKDQILTYEVRYNL
jgi:translation initiation factor 4E